MLALAVAGAAVWHAVRRIGCGAVYPKRDAPPFDVEVLSTSGSRVTLRGLRVTDACGTPVENWRKRGVWGLEWPGGYAQVGDIVQLDAAARVVVRPLWPHAGMLAAGTRAHLDAAVFRGDPAQAFGLPCEHVTYASELGPMPAWLVPGRHTTWAILVHGKGVTPREGLRILPTLHALGCPVLGIAYRNDAQAPGGQHLTYGYGQTEWRDLEAAVTYARARGAVDVLLVGFSMGGAIVMSFLLRSAEASCVAGVILDAPMLDLGGTVEAGLRAAGVPRPIRGVILEVARHRYGLDWRALDYVRQADGLRAPILVIHGAVDHLVPASTSDALATRRPDLVTYEKFAGAHHVGAWNVDRARYEAAVRAFVPRVARLGALAGEEAVAR